MSTKTCKTCDNELPLTAFEQHVPGKHRNECKPCRSKGRKEAVKNAVCDPEAAVLPEKCDRCNKAPSSDTKFELRNDLVKTLAYRTTCNQCRNGADPDKHKRYVQRQREADEEGYLARNAKKMREYRETHADEISTWATKNTNRRLGAIKAQAQKKGILWDVNSMSRDVCDDLMRSPCWYCGYLDLDITINGIDRLDSGGIYTIANCKPACGPCNWSKRCLDPLTFIERCQHIHGIAWFPHAWPDRIAGTFGDYQERANSNDIPFHLTRQQFVIVQNGICSYCKRLNTATHVNGIDRIDSSGGYTIDNVCTACTECNYMKGKMSRDAFLALCAKVAVYQRGEIPFVARQLHSVYQWRA